jgi:hypothetical protein
MCARRRERGGRVTSNCSFPAPRPVQPGCELPPGQAYHPRLNPKGVQCPTQDCQAAIWDRRGPKCDTAPVELENVGVPYGLSQLEHSVITPARRPRQQDRRAQQSTVFRASRTVGPRARVTALGSQLAAEYLAHTGARLFGSAVGLGEKAGSDDPGGDRDATEDSVPASGEPGRGLRRKPDASAYSARRSRERSGSCALRTHAEELTPTFTLRPFVGAGKVRGPPRGRQPCAPSYYSLRRRAPSRSSQHVPVSWSQLRSSSSCSA